MIRPIFGRSALWFAAFAMVIAAGTAHAAVDREAALFDHVLKVQIIRAKSADDPTGQITCTYYTGLMVRETGTDSPDPSDATMISYSGTKRPVCGRTVSAIAIAMKTDGFSLLGRKGPYLVFSATDPNGAVDFDVIGVSSGAILFDDGKTEAGFRAVTLKGDVLGLTYRRGLNAICSLLQEGAACWAKLVGDGSIPEDMAKTPLPIQACEAAYRKGPTPATADDPSIIEYDQVLTMDASGKTHVVSRGPVGCEAMP